jgi:hypothetical protein
VIPSGIAGYDRDRSTRERGNGCDRALVERALRPEQQVLGQQREWLAVAHGRERPLAQQREEPKRERKLGESRQA